ncbi:MAG: bifunctional phosphopantothenoylcysteine decarboxylase/phosphopantothenate--cysteine ligase CoaBC [Bacteroidaceae bacterium]|nr:bifunctional phosphopantothenoylcysteine decarboxylase/phosphopantothenate--cysteine ligase CoaBC [Bacteroidaceae bacterium]
MFTGKKIVLGITGSIAAYKACTLIRLLVKAGNEVQVVITPAGKEFITPITLSALTSKPVVSDFFSGRDGSWNSHVDLGLWADAMVIAPATASTIGKMAHGIADNMLLTTYLSMKAPVFVAPAMDLDMYAHPATQANLKCLRERGNIVIEAANGELASHLVGKGRMQEPEHIMNVLDNYFAAVQPLKGRRILITAGPTYERIDPVRFIGNFSTGKMGFALAEACVQMGASVELLSGPVALPTPQGARRHDVTSAQEMLKAAQELFPQCDAAILCAAVADYTPASQSPQKIKRTDEGMHIDLVPTADIAAELGKTKGPKQKLVGFALETNDETVHAEAKLKKKNFDFIVLNSLRDEGAGFGVDTNKVTIISAEGAKEYPLKSKHEVAKDIIEELCKRL